MGLIQRYKDWRAYETRAATLEEVLLQANVGVDNITIEQAMQIPTLAASVELISNTIAMLPINLYQEQDSKVSIVNDDVRVSLLNDDTKDTLDAFQFKKAIIKDYLLAGTGYAYINKERNAIKSLHYVDESVVSINKNSNPIFKDYSILVNGQTYRPFDFIKLIRNTKDGATGSGIVDANNNMLTVAYLMLKYEKLLMVSGGNKKGFIKAQKKLSEDAMTALKTAWNNLYKDNTDNVIVLNEGLDFKEASSTSVELQLNENKQTNASEITKLFGIPSNLWDSGSSVLYVAFIKICILPIIKAFETSLNRDILLEIEKKKRYFAFDTKDLMKGDMVERFKAYEIAVKNGFMQWDEIRYLEDYEPYNLDFIKLGLQDVLFNPKTKEIYTPNTDKTSTVGDSVKGGEDEDESGNQE